MITRFHVVLHTKGPHARMEDRVVDTFRSQPTANRSARAIARERFGKAEFKADATPTGGYWFDAEPSEHTEGETIRVKNYIGTDAQ